MATDASTMLSDTFSLGDLAYTTQNLSAPNLPTTQAQMDALTYSARNQLQALLDKVGGFQILSGFRTKELQQKLTDLGEPTSKNLSFHEVGRGFDILPTDMPLDTYFGLILADPELRDSFAEIAYKPGQGTIHLATNVPGDWRSPKITALNASQVYAGLSAEDIADYANRAIASVSDAAVEVGEVVAKNKLPILIITGVVAAGIVLYFMSATSTPSRA